MNDAGGSNVSISGSEDFDTELADIEFPADLTHAQLVESCKELIARAQQQLMELNSKSSGRGAGVRFSRFHDALLRAINKYLHEKWEERELGNPGSFALIALGGYGRRELSLRSDIDLLFLIGSRKVKQEEFIKEFLYILFDLKLELGYVVRRTEDCLQAIGTDLQSTTAMMESRWIAGSRPTFQQYHELFYRALRTRGRRWFLQALYQEWQDRHQKYDVSIYLAQPNIKESSGGLRDIHSVRWLLYVLNGPSELSALEDLADFSVAEVRRYRQAEDFVLKLRNELHALSPRKNDVLTFDAQIEITKRLEYEPTEEMHAAEVLMREYYQRGREIAKFSNRAFFTLLHGEKSTLGTMFRTFKRKRIDPYFYAQDGAIHLYEKQRNYLAEDPARIMTLFARARKMGLRVGERTRDLIEKIVPKLDEAFPENPACHKDFINLMGGPRFVARTLTDLHDCGFLSAYIPEFERIHCMVRMDQYHRYTVDEHLLKAVENLERLLNEPKDKRSHAAGIAAQLDRLDLMNISLLLHDVGKGYGKGHALRGGQIIQRIGSRLELEADDIEILRFLVLSHLKISHIAQRRDPEDPAVGRDLAAEVGTLEKLKMLYVHSVCDLMAVSPEAWTDWKARLFEACYRSAAAVLEGQTEPEPAPHPPIEQIADRIWGHIRQHPPEGAPSDKEELERLRKRLEEFLEAVPARYLQVIHVDIIAKHFWMIQQLNENDKVLWTLMPGLGVSDLAVCSSDVPGSFAMMCGALSAKDVNICSAQIFSTLDGCAVNLFQLTDLQGQPLPDGFRLDRLRTDLNQVFLEKKTMEELLQKYKSSSVAKRPPRISRPTEVWIDNDASQEFTIFEVRTGDRPGLLFQITSFLDSNKLNINRAIVSTEAYGVIDVFYVTDLEYNKIHDEPRTKRLQEELARMLEAS